jgi:hypothetical protein
MVSMYVSNTVEESMGEASCDWVIPVKVTLLHVIAASGQATPVFRYSTNWGSSFSDWRDYKGGNDTIDKLPWSGTKDQEGEASCDWVIPVKVTLLHVIAASGQATPVFDTYML